MKFLMILLMAVTASAGKEKPLNAAIGQTEAQVIKLWGKPDAQTEFRMVEAGGQEFRIELQNTYPLPANADVRIRELTWNTGPVRETVWFHRIKGEWRGLHAKRWHKDMEF